MISYSQSNVFTDAELRAWRAVTKWIDRIPRMRAGAKDIFEVRCHELARASLFTLQASKLHKISDDAKVEDGHYGMIDHSWIRLGTRTILDTYTCGKMPMVQLVSQLTTLPHFDLYKPGAYRNDIDQPLLDWLNYEMTFQLESMLR